MRPRLASHRRPWVTILSLAALGLGLGCRDRTPPADQPRVAPTADAASADAGPDEPPEPQVRKARYPGTRYMVQRLAKLAERASFKTNPYLNDRRVPWFAKLLAETTSPMERAWGRVMHGRERLRAGDSAGAIQDLEASLRERALPADRRRKALENLAVAWLRQGEQENCTRAHTSESCIFPIRTGGRHHRTEGSRRAKELFLRLLADDPDNLSHRWLLNIAAMTLGEHPDGVPERWRIPLEALKSSGDVGRFRDVAMKHGLDVVGLAGGVVTEDFDGDGRMDVLVSSWGARDPMNLFLRTPDGGYADRTKEAGLTGITGGLNMVQSDYDNDGDIDVLVLRGAWMGKDGRHPNSLLRNEGGGRFVDATEEAGLLTLHPTQTAAWADFDRDGHVDLFIGNESRRGDTNPSELFRNNGDGTFERCEDESGASVRGFVKAAIWGDVDNDGDPDLYVSRLGEPNLLLRNEGAAETRRTDDRPCAWRFVDVGAKAGVQGPIRSFPAWFWDYDNDGHLDLFVSGWGTESDGDASDVAAAYLGLPHKGEPPRLYRNNGDGTFTDKAAEASLGTPLLTMGCNFGDLDNDGWLDFYVATGEPDFRVLVPNRMFRGDGRGGFEDVTTSGGFGHLQKGHGVAFTDLDDDGDQDVFAVMGGAYTGDVYANALFENPGHGRHWITVRLRGVRANRAAIGARLRVHLEPAQGAPRVIHRTVGSGGSFGAGSLQQEIGLGAASAIHRIEIDWPGGDLQVVERPPVDRIVSIRQGEAARVIPPP